MQLSDGPPRKSSDPEWLVVTHHGAQAADGATLPASSLGFAAGSGPVEEVRTPWVAGRLPVAEPDQRYQVIKELARGGLGRVVRAHDLRLGRVIVLKELLGAGAHTIERFLREARITARLQHPAIVPVHDVGRWPNGVPFYAMKEVSGPTLDEVISRARGRTSERLALLPIVLAVAEAMAYAHSERIIHRDLKPANVVVGPFGETMVIDWGLAKDLAEAEAATAAAEADTPAPAEAEVAAHAHAPAPLASASGGIAKTVVGMIMGTPAYMPPEQARGEPVDARADVYAIGAMLYHVLAGAPPYDGASPQHIVASVLAAPPPPLAERAAHVPADLDSIVAKAMARDPAQRYPSARELADDLKRRLQGQLVASHRYSRAELAGRFIARHRAPVAVAATFLVLLGVLAGLGVRKLSRGRAEAETRRNELVLLQARSALDKDPTAAIAYLKEYPVDGPDWEKTRAVAIDAVSRGVARQVLTGHAGMVWRLAFAPDGTHLASASADGTLRLWDLASGHTERVLTGHTAEVDCVSFSPDGRLLATGSDDKTVRLWDVGGTATGARRVLTGHTGAVIEAVFFAHGTRLATASYDRTVRVWDVQSGEGHVLASLDGAGDLNQIAFSPDEKTLAVVGKDNNVYLLDVESGTTRVLGAHDNIVRGVAWSPDGRWVASAGYDRMIRLWDVAAGTSRVLAGHTGRVYTVSFSPDGTRLASASEDESVRVWDLVHGSESRVLRGHQGLVSTVVFSADGRHLGSAGFDKRIRIWDVPPFESRTFTGFGPGATRAAAFAADGRTLGFCGSEGGVAVADVDSGRLRPLGSERCDALDLSPDGRRLGSVTADGVPRVWDVDSGAMRAYDGSCDNPIYLIFSPDGERVLLDCGAWSLKLWPLTPGDAAARRSFDGYQESIQAMRFSPDGKRIGSTSGSELWIWDVASGERTVLRGHEGWVAPGFHFSSDSRRVASGANDQTARVWDLATGSAQKLIGHKSGVRATVFSPDGKLLATAGYDKTVRIWDLATGKSRVLPGHQATIHFLAFSPDGSLLASSSSADLTIRLWDVHTGASRALLGHKDAITAIAFTPDGTQLMSASDDHTVRLWSAKVGDDLPADARSLRRWIAGASSAVLDRDDLPTSR